MKNFFIKLMSVALFVAVGTFFSSCISNADNSSGNMQQEDPYKDKWLNKTAKYTVMLYGCGGGDADTQLDYAIDYVKHFLKADNNQVRFVVMYSTSKNPPKHRENHNEPVNLLYGHWASTYRYELTPGITTENYHERCYYKPASEVELYRVETIKEFINWTKQTAPAENYILMPTNHGGGFDLEEETPIRTRSIIYDDNHVDEKGDNKGVATKAFAQALQETQTHLKAIYWNGCLMGQLEVLTEMAPYCDYQFGSAHLTRVNPRHVYGIIEAINTFPDDFEQAAKQHGTIMNAPNGNLQYYDYNFLKEFQNLANPKNQQEVHDENCDFGCWRSEGLTAINTQVKKLADFLDANYDTYVVQFGTAIWATYNFAKGQPYLDVLDLVFKVDEAFKTDEGLAQDPKRNDVAPIKQDLDNALKAACVYHIDGLHSMQNVENVQVPTWPGSNRYTLGISLYSKGNETYKKYKNVYKESSFDKFTGWSRFLDKNIVDIRPDLNPSNNSWEDPVWI